MKKFITTICVVWIMVMVSSTFANNIIVGNVSLEGQVVADHYCLVEFDLAWANSWRTTSIPQNWDAAWVFVKYSVAGGPWQHAKLSSVNSVIPSGATADFGDSTGVFVYRDADGSGIFSVTNIGLRWNYGDNGVADDASVEVKVFAIEMVYVPEGTYYLGDSTSFNRFYAGSDNKSFYQVSSEIAITVSGTNPDHLWAAGDIGAGTIPLEYPKGFNAFYCMKYEVSQEQYVEFLICLDRTQQDNRVNVDISGTSLTNIYILSNNSSIQRRNGVSAAGTLPASGPIDIFCNYDEDVNGNETNDGQNIACNYLNWPHSAAYLDWSGLRPMTELEFEKACRGPNNPIGGEFAWGNTLVNTTDYTLSNPGETDEVINNMPQDTGNCHFDETVALGSYGPLRCGAFAASSTNNTRMETGATYYGIMEMSGNVNEFAVNNYFVAGRSFTGLHGNGFLTSDGNADVDHWPGMEGNTDGAVANGVFTSVGVTAYAGIGIRGGGSTLPSMSLITHIPISSREHARGFNFSSPLSDYGSRGVRTAP